ncbi:uncharacterized protein [Fopius arisanus]|uniref:Uncharacterized protein n=1 Tax=Fopius arisanus TaxID=64838 RepID=A0A9R1SZX2_9HYME|nr:PREDICTED: uncharacterized protein LOC105264758 [Fopius arisanus]
MKNERLFVLAVLVTMLILRELTDGKKVVIHLPYKVKNIKHTHTVYKVLPQIHEERKNEHSEEPEEFDHFTK